MMGSQASGKPRVLYAAGFRAPPKEPVPGLPAFFPVQNRTVEAMQHQRTGLFRPGAPILTRGLRGYQTLRRLLGLIPGLFTRSSDCPFFGKCVIGGKRW